MNSLTVFLDVGGTLLDSSDLFTAIADNLTNKPNKQSDETTGNTVNLVLETFMKEYKNIKGFISVEGIIAATLTSLADNHGYPDIASYAHDIYYDVFLHKSSLFPETLSFLDTLHNNDVTMIIASDSDTKIMEQQLIKHHFKKYFTEIFTSDLVKAYKPSDKFVRYLEKYTFNNQENCYFVGDKKQDVECGNKLGINSVLVDRKNSKEKMNADYVIHDLKELLPILGLK